MSDGFLRKQNYRFFFQIAICTSSLWVMDEQTGDYGDLTHLRGTDALLPNTVPRTVNGLTSITSLMLEAWGGSNWYKKCSRIH